MREAFHGKLAQRGHQLAGMCAASATAMRQATFALLEADRSLTEHVLGADAALDAKPAECEEHAYSLLHRGCADWPMSLYPRAAERSCRGRMGRWRNRPRKGSRLMTYQPGRELNLTYDPQQGWFNFVLYTETPKSWGSALNATQQLRESSRYTQEWIGRLQDTEPTPLHMALVSSNEAPRLWDPCVFDDPESPSAVAGDGCLCLTTLYDPLTWLPVVKQHYRTVSGNIENWTYWTFSPLSLPEGQVLERLIIDRDAGVMWLRNDRGELHFLPEKTGEGYNVGYGGGGPGKFAAMIEKIVASDGHDVTPDTSQVTAHPHLDDWACSPVSDRTRELSLAQLRTLRTTGTAPA